MHHINVTDLAAIVKGSPLETSGDHIVGRGTQSVDGKFYHGMTAWSHKATLTMEAWELCSSFLNPISLVSQNRHGLAEDSEHRGRSPDVGNSCKRSPPSDEEHVDACCTSRVAWKRNTRPTRSTVRLFPDCSFPARLPNVPEEALCAKLSLFGTVEFALRSVV